MIELTAEQLKAIAEREESPPQIFDANDDRFANDLLPEVMKVLGRDGWDSPDMDIYNDLDPRVTP